MLDLNFCSRKRIKKTYRQCIPLCFGVCLLFHWIFRLNCRTTVTPFIRRRLLCFCIFSSYKVFYFPWSPVMRHQCVHYKVHMSPMACKLFYTLFSCGEFGLPVVAFDGVEYFCNDAFLCLFEGKWCSTFSSVMLKRMKPSVINRYHKMMKSHFIKHSKES